MLFDLTDRPARRVPGRVHVWEAWLLGVWLIALVALAHLFPRSGDDWAWGAPEGWDRAQHLFAGINGRYAGNVAVVLLTRAGPLTPVVVAATVVATLVLVLHLARARTPLGYAVVGSLFLLMPLGVWRQGVVWLSGLVNYAFGTVFLLLLLVVARREADEDVPRSRPAALAACVLGGLVGALFMEHVTLCACLVGGALTVVGRVRSGSWPLRTAAWTAGSWSGAAVMFSNSAYRTALSGGSYQSVQATSGAPAQERLLVRLADYLPAHALTHVGSAAVALPALVLVLALSPRPDRRAAHAGLAALAVVVVGLEVQQLLGVRRDVVDGHWTSSRSPPPCSAPCWSCWRCGPGPCGTPPGAGRSRGPRCPSPCWWVRCCWSTRSVPGASTRRTSWSCCWSAASPGRWARRCDGPRRCSSPAPATP